MTDRPHVAAEAQPHLRTTVIAAIHEMPAVDHHRAVEMTTTTTITMTPGDPAATSVIAREDGRLLRGTQKKTIATILMTAITGVMTMACDALAAKGARATAIMTTETVTMTEIDLDSAVEGDSSRTSLGSNSIRSGRSRARKCS